MSFTIGVLGGMGPLATRHFLGQIYRKIPTACDQDYPNIVLSSRAETPDRSAYLMGSGPSPVPALVRALSWLAEEADVIAMPCNTAHAFYGLLQSRCPVPLLHMPNLCAEHLAKSNVNDVLLLGTEGTLYAGIYQGILRDKGIHVSLPPRAFLPQVADAIAALKRGGFPPDDFFAYCDTYAERAGCDRILLGCTEFSLCTEEFAFPCTDPTEALAREAARLHLRSAETALAT